MTLQPESQDPMAAVRAWVVRMTLVHGPKVWDQERRIWLTWEEALTKQCFGEFKTWILDTPVWSTASALAATSWESIKWPDWAVKAHLVDTRPCEFEDHRWKLVVDKNGTQLVCNDPCDDPRIYWDNEGRYVYPACQNIPPMEYMKYEVEVKPEWVYRDEKDWWVELDGEVLQEKPH